MNSKFEKKRLVNITDPNVIYFYLLIVLTCVWYEIIITIKKWFDMIGVM